MAKSLKAMAPFGQIVMSRSDAVRADKLKEGDRVTVHVNSRARDHLGTSEFEAVVDDTSLSSVVFDPVDNLESQEVPTHTWYTGVGYIHGTHTGLGRYSDIGKVNYVERTE